MSQNPVILNPSEMLRTLSRYEAEYRRQLSFGQRVIRVVCTGREPRISAWIETISRSGNLEKEPMSMGMTEIELFVADARKELSL